MWICYMFVSLCSCNRNPTLGTRSVTTPLCCSKQLILECELATWCACCSIVYSCFRNATMVQNMSLEVNSWFRNANLVQEHVAPLCSWVRNATLGTRNVTVPLCCSKQLILECKLATWCVCCPIVYSCFRNATLVKNMSLEVNNWFRNANLVHDTCCPIV